MSHVNKYKQPFKNTASNILPKSVVEKNQTSAISSFPFCAKCYRLTLSLSCTAGIRPGLLRVRGEKPQGPTDELHQRALCSSTLGRTQSSLMEPDTWLRMDTTSEAGWWQHWSPHLNKPPWPTSENLRAQELKESRKNPAKRDAEGYGTGCTNRPLKCRCGPLFSFTGQERN